MNMTTMRMYCPSLKENVEATITDGKQVASKGGSLRNIIYGEFEGRKCLPKTVKADVFAQHGFAAEYEDVMKDIENLSDDDYVDFCQYWGIDPDDTEEVSSFLMKNKDSPDVQGWITGRLMGFSAESEGESATYEPSQEPEGSTPATEPTNANFEAEGDWSAENSGKMNLTMKELLILILVNKDWNENDWGGSGEYEDITASFYHDEVDMRKMRGVLSSLVKKGIITAQEDYVNKEKYTMVSVNNKYTQDLESIDWNMFDCKDELVQGMGYEKFIEWANNVPDTIIRGMMDSKFDAETFEDCEACYATVDKGTLNDVQAGRICNECHKMNQYEGGTKTIKTPYNAETFEAREDLICDYCEKIISPNEGSVNWPDSGLTVCDDCFDDAIKNAESSPSSFDISWEDAQGVSSPSLPPEGIHFAEEGDYRMNGEGCEYCAETRELNAEGFCSECASHAESFSASSYEDAFFTETVSEMAAEGISRNGKLALSLTALGIGVAMALGSDTVSSLLDKITRK